MEIGSNKGASHSLPLAESNLLIHLRRDGLDAVLVNSTTHDILKVYRSSWLPKSDFAGSIPGIESFFVERDIEIRELGGLSVFISAPKFTVIPDILYEQGSGRQILRNTCRINSVDPVFSDFLGRRDAVLIYSLEDSFYQELKSLHPAIRIAHSGYALNALALKQTISEDYYLASISDAFAEFMIVQQGNLVFYNQFPHEVPEDILYYFLFVLEQNRILAPEVKLQVIQGQKTNTLKELLATYVGTVEDVVYKESSRFGHNHSQNELRQIAHLHATL